jgi:hypothetical protein
MLYRPSSLRKKATTFAAAAAMVGSAFGFTAAAFAEDVASNSSPFDLQGEIRPDRCRHSLRHQADG